MSTRHTWTDLDGLNRGGGRRIPEDNHAEVAVEKEDHYSRMKLLTQDELENPNSYPALMKRGSGRLYRVVSDGRIFKSNATEETAGTGWIYVSGGEWVSVTGNVTIAAHNTGSMWRFTSAATITVPEGLSSPPTIVIMPPASGDITISVSGSATINGDTASLTRDRATNPGGFAIVPYGGNAYGVSGC